MRVTHIKSKTKITAILEDAPELEMVNARGVAAQLSPEFMDLEIEETRLMRVRFTYIQNDDEVIRDSVVVYFASNLKEEAPDWVCALVDEVLPEGMVWSVMPPIVEGYGV